MQPTSTLEKRLRELMRVFLKENESINLSALRTEDACWVGNILDSLPMLSAIPATQVPKSLIDIGTGGGFPLLPLAMALPSTRCVGLDAIGKKIRAVERMARALNLRNVDVVAERTEVLGHDPQHREHYDLVTSRAVAELRTLAEHVSPFVKTGGTVALWKSMHIENELAEAAHALASCHLELQKSHVYRLPDPFGERQILILKKTAPLPPALPRAIGMAKKNPL